MNRKEIVNPGLYFYPNSRLGAGGFADVYRGIYNCKQRGQVDCAVKLLRTYPTDPMHDLRRRYFEQESYISTNLEDHPNVIKTFAAGEHKGSLYIVMEYCKNGSLTDYVFRQKKPLAEELIKPFAVDILKGLHHIHSKGLCHRDLKFDNVLLDANNTIKIADFGFAKFRNVEGSAVFPVKHSVLGTPGFMPPEIFSGKLSSKGDIFAFGCMVYFMACGRWVELAGNDLSEEKERKQKFKSHKIKFDPVYYSNPVLVDFIRRCLQEDQAQRFSAAELLAHPWLCGIDKNDLRLSALNLERIEKLAPSFDEVKYESGQAEQTLTETIQRAVSEGIYRYSAGLYSVFNRLQDVFQNSIPPIAEDLLGRWQPLQERGRLLVTLLTLGLDNLQMGGQKVDLFSFSNWVNDPAVQLLLDIEGEKEIVELAKPHAKAKVAEFYLETLALLAVFAEELGFGTGRDYVKYFKSLLQLFGSKCGELKIKILVDPKVVDSLSSYKFTAEQKQAIVDAVLQKAARHELEFAEFKIGEGKGLTGLKEVVDYELELVPFLN